MLDYAGVPRDDPICEKAPGITRRYSDSFLRVAVDGLSCGIFSARFWPAKSSDCDGFLSNFLSMIWVLFFYILPFRVFPSYNFLSSCVFFYYLCSSSIVCFYSTFKSLMVLFNFPLSLLFFKCCSFFSDLPDFFLLLSSTFNSLLLSAINGILCFCSKISLILCFFYSFLYYVLFKVFYYFVIDFGAFYV